MVKLRHVDLDGDIGCSSSSSTLVMRVFLIGCTQDTLLGARSQGRMFVECPSVDGRNGAHLCFAALQLVPSLAIRGVTLFPRVLVRRTARDMFCP